jgi:aryl-alcohol dehydrogenase-like predicted oxidoreductase
MMRYVDAPPLAKVSVIGLGTWQFGSREWGYGSDYARTEAHAIVRRAHELGITLFDTAEIYAFGRSERILGEALAAVPGARESSVIASKLLPVLPVGPVVEQRAVASADRLGVTRIDLYQVHAPNPVVRDNRTMPAMAALRRVGLVGAVGVSNYSLDRWRDADRALGSPVVSNQVEYSLLRRGPERDLLPFAQRENRLVIAYSPLAQGLLSGRYNRDNPPARGVRSMNPLFLPDNLDAAQGVIDLLRDVADAHGATPAQIALAWLIRHPRVVAIPGASSVAQVESNAAAAEIELTDGEFDALTAAADQFRPVTGRAAYAGLLRQIRPGARSAKT